MQYLVKWHALIAARGVDAAILINRLIFGGLMIKLHGWTKLVSFADWLPEYPDPLGVGKTLSLALSVAMQVFGCFLLIVGWQTRTIALLLTLTMLVAAFVVKMGSTLMQRELAILYAFAYLMLYFSGGGRYSLDHVISSRK